MATIEQISELRTEAGGAGDAEQVAICDRALAGDKEAIAECERVITEAQAEFVYQAALDERDGIA